MGLARAQNATHLVTRKEINAEVLRITGERIHVLLGIDRSGFWTVECCLASCMWFVFANCLLIFENFRLNAVFGGLILNL